jgi:16S rRNA processing protein RimM
MDFDSCYELGYITKPHGLKGDVSIVIDADTPEAYRNLESVFIEQDKQLVPFFVSAIKLSGNKAILSLEESTNIEFAQTLKGAKLFLPLDFLPELDDDQFYFHEIIGFTISDQESGILGKIETVYDAGPQDLIAFIYKQKEILLPINDNTIIKVDKESRTLHVSIPDGLLDIYLNDQ